MIDGQFDGTELWFRCHHCGDSTRHPSKAHCSVNVFTNVYHCYRCSASGKLSGYESAIFTRDLNFDRSKIETDPMYEPDSLMDTIRDKMRHGPGQSRYSAADRYHIKTSTGAKIDVFKVCDPSQNVVGYHVRPQDKKKTRTYGKRLFIVPSTIRYDRPWRLVEGPYDMLDPHSDIAVLGFPSEMQVKTLSGKRLILCPDGDVFEDYRKLRQFMKPFLYNTEVMIEYVEKLPPGTDPDEIMPSRREHIPMDEVREILRPKKSFFAEWVKPEQVLEDIKINIPESEFWKAYENV